MPTAYITRFHVDMANGLAASEPSRYRLDTLRIEHDHDTGRSVVVVSDGTRLAVAPTAAAPSDQPEDVPVESPALIDVKSLKEAAKLLRSRTDRRRLRIDWSSGEQATATATVVNDNGTHEASMPIHVCYGTYVDWREVLDVDDHGIPCRSGDNDEHNPLTGVADLNPALLLSVFELGKRYGDRLLTQTATMTLAVRDENSSVGFQFEIDPNWLGEITNGRLRGVIMPLEVERLRKERAKHAEA